jgi:hypothetical protein
MLIMSRTLFRDVLLAWMPNRSIRCRCQQWVAGDGPGNADGKVGLSLHEFVSLEQPADTAGRSHGVLCDRSGRRALSGTSVEKRPREAAALPMIELVESLDPDKLDQRCAG